MCLKDCHPPELQWHRNESRLEILLVFCLLGRNLDHSFLQVFLLFPSAKWPNMCRNKMRNCVSPASRALGPVVQN